MTKCLRVSGMPGKQEEGQCISGWVYEFDIEKDDLEKLEKAATACGTTFDEFFISAMEFACEKTKDDPEGFEADRRHVLEHPEEHLQIELARCYPVREGETDSQAKERYLMGGIERLL